MSPLVARTDIPEASNVYRLKLTTALLIAGSETSSPTENLIKTEP